MKFALSLPGLSGTPIDILAPSGIPSGGLSTTGQDAISLIINVLLIVAILLSLTFIIWGGIRWMTSRGKKEELEKAKTTLIYAIVGLAVAFLAFLIIGVIQYFFNVSLLVPWPGACRYAANSSNCTACYTKTYYDCNTVNHIDTLDSSCSWLCKPH